MTHATLVATTVFAWGLRMIVLHREVRLRKLWGTLQIECERSQPERSLFRIGVDQ
jgi:hypothetical protein